MKTKTFTLIVVLVLAAGALAVSACGDTATEDRSSSIAPSDVEIVAPSDFAVADYAGRPLVVNFFGSWCGPCNDEAPDLASFAANSADVQFVGIAVDDSESDATGFMAEYGLAYPLVVDDGRLSGEYGITGVPTTIFFDAQGQEKDRIIGAATVDQFNASLTKAQ